METTLNIMLKGLLLKPEDAIKYFDGLGIYVSDDIKTTMKNIRADAFTIAGVNKMDRLIAAKDLIKQAMFQDPETAISIKEFQKKMRLLLNTTQTHANIVVTQNIANAHNAGRLIRSLDDETGNFPLIRPIVKKDIKTTDICMWLANNKVCFRVDDKMLKNMYSPRHFRCRTIYIAITEDQAKKYGLKVRPISSVPQKYWNKLGFRTLPTKAYKPNLKGYPSDLVKKYKAR